MTCPDKIVENGDCIHDKKGYCSLSKYFKCIENQLQTQDQNPNLNQPQVVNPNRSPASPTLAESVASAGSIVVPRLSYSALQDFGYCHLKFYRVYKQRIELIQPKLAMLKGSCGHAVLQYIHTAEQPELAGINNIVDGFQDFLSPSSSTPSPSLEALKPLGWAYLEMEQYSSFHGRAEVEWETEDKLLHGFLDLVQYEEGE